MKGPIARGTIRTTFVLGLRLLVQAGTLLIVARMLGPHQFGAFAGVAALAVILGTLSTFGTHIVLLGEVAKDPVRREEVLRYALPTTLLTGSLLLAIYLVVCVLALNEVGVALHLLLLLGATEMLLQPLIVLCAAEHHGLGHIARSQMLIIMPLLFRLGAAVTVFVLSPPDPLGSYAWGYCVASLIALVAVFSTRPAPWPPIDRWRMPRFTDLKNAAGFAALNISAAGPTELDKTLAAKLLPLGAAGMYAAAARIVGATTLPISAMTASALPRLFREGQNRSKHTVRLLRWMFGTAIIYGLLLATVLWIVAPMFDWIFGIRFQGVGYVVRWLCPAIPGMALRRVGGNVLMAFNRPWSRFGFEATGLAMLAIVSVVAVSSIGVVGMPIALLSSEWAMAILGILLVTVESGRQYYGPQTPRSTTGPASSRPSK